MPCVPPRSKQVLSFGLFPSSLSLFLCFCLGPISIEHSRRFSLGIEAPRDCGIAGSAAVCKRSTTELDREPRNARENTPARALWVA